MDYRALESKVLELEKQVVELGEFRTAATAKVRNVKNSPIVMGYEGKRFDLNESLDVVKLLGRVKALEGEDGGGGFDEWLASSPKVSLFENDAGYLTELGSEVDPVFSSWVGSSPNISLFNNNVGYLTIGSIADDLTVGHLYPSAAYKNIGASDNKWYNLYVGGTAHLAGVQITGDASYVSLNMTNAQAVDAMSRIFFTNGLGDSAWIGFMSEGMNVWDYYPNILYINGNGHVDFCDNTIWDIGKLGIKEGGASPEYQTFFQGGNQSGDITYTLPTTNDTGLLKNTAGTWSWITDNSGNWNTAYGWGNHAGLYALLSHSQAESTITFTDITTGNVTTTAHGYCPKANTIVSDGTIRYLGIAYGETSPSYKLANANPGANPAVLKTDINGLLTLQNLTIGSFVTAGIVHNSAAGILSTSAVVNADLGNLGTAGKLAKLGATGLADSLFTETADAITLASSKYLFLSATAGTAYDGLFIGDVVGGTIYAGLQALQAGGSNYLYFANGRKFAFVTGWADTTGGTLPGGMFLVLGNTFNFSSFAIGSLVPVERMSVNASGYIGFNVVGAVQESPIQYGNRCSSDVVDSPAPIFNIIGDPVDNTPQKMLRLMRKGRIDSRIQVNATADFNLSTWGPGGAGDVYRGRAKLDINLKNDTVTYDWTETADETILSLYSDGRVAMPTDSANFLIGAGLDAGIQYDGTNLLITPDLVGTGKVIINTAQAIALTIGKGSAGIDYQLTFDGETNDGVLTWMEDEDYFKFSDDIMLAGGENIVLDTSTGTKIGTATSQLLGFYNATPVNQPDTVADPAGGTTVDAEARTAINTIIDRLQELGLIA